MGSRKNRTRSIPCPRSVPTVQKLKRATRKQDYSVSKLGPTAPLRRSARLQNIVEGIKAKEHHRQPPSSSPTAPPKRPQSQTRKQLHLHDTCLDERSPSDKSRVSLKSYEKVLEPPYNPVAKTTSCPKEFSEEGFPRNYENITKPRSSAMDHSDCTEMAKCGIHMEASDLIHTESKDIIWKYLGSHQSLGTLDIDKGLGYPVERITEILHLHQGLGSSKARVQKDITPWVVPSVQDLFFRGVKNLACIGEEIREEWKCKEMGMGQPKPDYVVGLLPNKAFIDDEIQKLQKSASSAAPFLFTRQLCFPFLMCEVTTHDQKQGLVEADRRNIHSASIAVRAIIELYQAAFGTNDPDRVNKLNGQVLVFTISHDDMKAKLYGHYATSIVGGRSEEMLEFHRHHIGTYSFTEDNGAERFTAYKFVYNIYEQFAPLHQVRIKAAAASLPTFDYEQAMSIARQATAVTVNDQVIKDLKRKLQQQDEDFRQLNRKLQQQDEQNKKRDEEIEELKEMNQRLMNRLGLTNG
jgi:hypothetical protein